jgi:hypothetical protein
MIKCLRRGHLPLLLKIRSLHTLPRLDSCHGRRVAWLNESRH